MRTKLHFIIIGVQKGGSTWLAKSLRKHAEVGFVPGGFTMFERSDFDAMEVADKVDALMQDAAAAPCVGLKRTFFSDERVPGRLHRLFPDVKLIVALRDPIERAVSSYFQTLTTGRLPIQTFDQWYTSFRNCGPVTQWPGEPAIIDEGMYAKHLQNWWQHFDRSQMLVLQSSQLKADRAGSLKTIGEFLGLKAPFDDVDVSQSSYPGVYSLTHQRIARLLQPLYMQRTDDERMRKHRIGALSKVVRRIVVLGIERRILLPMFKRPQPEVQPAVRRPLAEHYRDDIERLQHLLGWDLSHWSTVRTLREIDELIDTGKPATSSAK